MSNKLLRRVMDNLDSVPMKEFEALVRKEIGESDLKQALLDTIGDGHAVVRKDLSIVFVNKALFALIPSRRNIRSYEGRSILDVITDKDLRAFIQGVFKGEDKADPKDFFFQKGNETAAIRVSFSSMQVGEENYMDIVFEDITDDLRKETKLRRSESLASMTTMAAGIAHEIKNPLAAMKIHLQLLRKAFQRKGSLTEDDAERYLSVIDEETNHLNSIAVDFLFAVRPMNIELTLGSINDVVNDLIVFIRPEAEEKGIEVVADLERFLPRVALDAKHMRQAVLNIVQNAIAAMAGGGRLAITTRLDGDYVSLRIADNGCGIDQEHLSKIFEPYFTTKSTGTGLGLTVVYKVVKEHDGDIQVHSELGKGTEFTIKLPVPKMQRRAIEEG